MIGTDHCTIDLHLQQWSGKTRSALTTTEKVVLTTVKWEEVVGTDCCRSAHTYHLALGHKWLALTAIEKSTPTAAKKQRSNQHQPIAHKPVLTSMI